MNYFLKITLALWFFTQLVQAQTPRLKVGNNPTTITSSAALEIESNSNGLLPPRMSKAQMNAITSPTEGLLVYCNDCTSKGLYVYDGASWTLLSSGSATVVADCNANGFSRSFIKSVPLIITFTVTITNNSFYSVPIAFQNSDLVLNGGGGGISVTGTSPASVTLNAGQSQVVTYTISSNPFTSGALTATWTKLGLSCIKTTEILWGDAQFTLPQSKDILSASGFQGLISNTAPNQITINVPYTGGLGIYDAFTGFAVSGTTGQGGDTNTFRISYPAGTFATTGTIPVTIVVDGDGSYSVKQSESMVKEIIATLPFVVDGSTKGDIVLQSMGGIPDRAYGQTINGAHNHNFVYTSVTAPNGTIWLNNNLGAHYSNKDHTSFNPTQQATSSTDHLAYGSIFQWGRGADGHELVNWTSSTGGPFSANTTTLSTTDNPGNALFISTSSGNFDWRNPQNSNLWQGEAGINNPCPVGYRVPTDAELTALVSAAAITNTATAASSTLKFTTPGRRVYNNTFPNLGTTGNYWSSTINGTNSNRRLFTASATSTDATSRGDGLSIRCIKD